MANSLPNFANNLSEGLDKIKCKYGHNNKKCEICGITYELCDRFLEYANLQRIQITKFNRIQMFIL